MAVETGEFQASQQAFKSIINRIEKAKRGFFTTGRLPTGRRYVDPKKKDKLENIPEVQKNVERAARMILEGVSIIKTAKIVGMNNSNLRETLLYRCGDTIIQKFSNRRFNIHEEVPTPVPRLLPQELIDAVKAKLEANKTICHGYIKNKYLLSRMVVCGHCGEPLFGSTDRNYQYYRHSKRGCKQLKSIRADAIEDAVFVHLFQMFGNQTAMEQAIKDAIPEKEELDQLPSQKEAIVGQLEKLKAERNRLLKSIAKGLVSDDEAAEVLQDYREKEAVLKDEIRKIDSKLQRVPNKKSIGVMAHQIKRHIEGYFQRSGEFAEMTFEDKKKLAQFAFSGKDPEGKRYGVYVEKTDLENYPWRFTLIGSLWPDWYVRNEILPMELYEAQGILGIEDESYDPFRGSAELKTLRV